MSNAPSISIAATFTAEPIAQSLCFMLDQAGVPLDVRFAPYHQVFQELLSQTGLLVKNAKGVNVVLIRIEDFIRDEARDEIALATIQRTTGELRTALASYASRLRVPTIVSILPPSPRASRFQSALSAANASLIAQIKPLPGMILLFESEIDHLSSGDQFDNVSDDLAHVPYSRNYYAALAIGIARKAHATLVPPHKVLVLDCDNTLWRGVVGEDGVDGIEITAAFAKLQDFAIKLHSEGTLLCLVSKNMESDVLDVFKTRSDMLLKLDHVVAHRINWQPKPQNIASLAKELNLGLDSFVFLDDNPVECASMHSELPQVVTLQIPPEERMADFLANLWTFDKIAVTEEDQRRTQLYKEDALRQESEATAADIGDFIASLNVNADIRAPNEKEWPRLAQLTQRTNQFNFTTKRRSEPELRAIAANGALVLRVDVADRFGDYGLVGLVVAQIETDHLNIDTLLLSCRVLGRGVEHAILRELGIIASSRDLSHVAIPFAPTPKNEPARAFIESVAGKYRQPEGQSTLYLIPSEGAIKIAHRPGFDPDAVIEARRQADSKVSTVTASTARSGRYERLARDLVRGDVVRIAGNSKSFRSLVGDAAPPTNGLERRLLGLWEEILAISGLGIDDDYFAIGGTSLKAVTLFARIARQFDVQLPLTTILSSPTVRAIAQLIQAKHSRRDEPLIQLKSGSLRNLFLVHDGEGETLLYANLARCLPEGLAVYGVNPMALPNVPLAHTRVEDMASTYIERIRKAQPQGPYLLGGMCAGGVIAYEMAHQLVEKGERVDIVLLLDAATPQALRRRHIAAKHRLQNFSQLIKSERSAHSSPAKRARRLIGGASKKTWNLLRWEATSRIKKLSAKVRFRLLRTLLVRGKPWPPSVPGLTARQIYECAEAAYLPRRLFGCTVVLARATTGQSGDTPYVDLYADNTLGWGAAVTDLQITDVDGGHYTMLQEPYVEQLGQTLAELLTSGSSECRLNSSVNEPA